MTALSVIAALVAAMFVTLAPARAATGDVSANAGYCVQTGTGDDAVYQVSTQTTLAADSDAGDRTETEVTVEVPDNGDASGDDAVDGGRDDDDEVDHIRIACNSAFAGQAVTITPDGSATPVVTLATPTLSVRVSDTDGLVKAGGADLTITVSFKNVVQFTHDLTNARDDDTATVPAAVTSTAFGVASDGTAQETTRTLGTDNDGGAGISLLWIRVSGELDDADLPADATNWAATTNSLTSTLAIPAGTSPGEYTISALAAYDPYSTAADDDDDPGTDDDEDFRTLSASTTITVGDPGVEADTVSLSLGNASEDNPLTTATTGQGELIPEDGTEPATGGDIWLKVSATNSQGKASNDAALNAITVIAPGGSIAIHAPNGRRTAPGDAVSGGSGSNSASITAKSNVVNTMFVNVKKADSKPGTVDVYTLLIGADGAPRSDTLTLTFTGASSSLVLGEADAVAPTGATEFTIDAQDAAGNPGGVGQLVFSVTDPDGKPVGQGENSKLGVTKDTAGSSTPDKDTDDNPLQTVGLVKTMSTTAPGVYTITVSLAGVADSEAETTVTVSGTAADVAVEVDKSDVALNDLVTATATVTDKNGAPVADGAAVTWGTFGELTLIKVSSQDETKDGQAVAVFGVSKGSGSAQITAVSGTGTGSAAVSAGPASTDEAVSLDCLSSLTGFSSYTCSMGSSASEIFGLLSGRGATAIHLWNGSMWV
ncbi:MAG: hypothetical protein OXH19_08700, partial [Chloroflexi bacterium]|nr:hypothetical protein [Chloroflexota bacterium]MCY3588850.1 hypothetical protein [Chloroflexota bacterium]MCY3685719.1 hypothetical protein [Chloroflexota bacterium]MDE2709203.1 hypothetical protein [Chloroflexota bacterium]